MIYNFLIYLLLHIVGDFYLQSDRLAKCKQANKDETCLDCIKCKEGANFNIGKIIVHVGIYMIPYLSLIYFHFYLKWEILIILGIIAISHLVIDLLTCFMKKKTRYTHVFLFDQALHILVIIAILFMVSPNIELNEKVIPLLVPITLLSIIIKPSALFINLIFQDLFGEKDLTLFDAGIIVGIVERIIIVCLAFLNAVSAIAIIIAAKTLVRYDQIKENKDNFKGKYLVGTLLSIAIPLLCFVVMKLIMNH